MLINADLIRFYEYLGNRRGEETMKEQFGGQDFIFL